MIKQTIENQSNSLTSALLAIPFIFPIRLPAIPGGHSIIQAQSPFESQSSLSKYGRKNLLDAPYPELGILNAIRIGSVSYTHLTLPTTPYV